MKNFRKNLAVFSVVTALTIGVAAQPSYAIWSVLDFDAVGADVGIKLASLGAAIGGLVIAKEGSQIVAESKKKTDILEGLGVALFGLVVLDSNSGLPPQFVSLDPKTADSIGITDPERREYNAQIHDVNEIYQSILSELVVKSKAGVSVNNLATISVGEWKIDEQGLTPNAQSALEKVRAHMGTAIQAALQN